MENEAEQLEEKDGVMLSRDRLLKLDPKKQQGRMTLLGQRIGTQKAKGSPHEIGEASISPGKDEKEN